MRENKRILIVDDEEKARLYLAQIVQELLPGCFIQFASSPVEAIFLLESQSIDLMLLDVEMPGMTGLEMLNGIRPKLNEVPVIFVSAYKRAEFIQSALRLNAVDYIDKPVDPVELETALIKAFTQSENTINIRSANHLKNEKLQLKSIKGIMHFDASEIFFFESHKRDAIVHFVNGMKDVIIKSNLTALTCLLPPDIFKRVSRQYIVNINYIKFESACNKTITLFGDHKTVVLKRIYPDFFKNRQ
jgi:two-component system, LytTR family, response regulator